MIFSTLSCRLSDPFRVICSPGDRRADLVADEDGEKLPRKVNLASYIGNESVEWDLLPEDTAQSGFLSRDREYSVDVALLHVLTSLSIIMREMRQSITHLSVQQSNQSR